MVDHISFAMNRNSLERRILIPKYYDPELAEAAELASDRYDLPRLGELLLPGEAGSRLGTWVARENYGTGPVPYVRTSDLNDWRIRPDFKKAVSSEVYKSVELRQDVRVNDLLMVAHGTYLVGAVAIVTDEDLPLVLQDHVFRLRVDQRKIDPFLLLVALSTRFVRRQIRAKQFSADIIDKIGNRHLDVRIPLPKNERKRELSAKNAREFIAAHSEIRMKMSQLLTSDLRMTKERAAARYAFQTRRNDIVDRILIPKFYDPVLRADLDQSIEESGVPWTSLGDLVNAGILEANTGAEVGKMAYGTGDIPFIRTTDIASLEVKAVPRQGISQAIYDQYAEKAAIAEGDVILVRDGTYLVGSSAIVSSEDVPAIFCGGLYRLRSLDRLVLSPFSLLALLNLPVVRRQMRAKQFTRDVIDTLGKRIFEVRIPDPSSSYAMILGKKLARVMESKDAVRALAREAIRFIEPDLPKSLRNRPAWSMSA